MKFCRAIIVAACLAGTTIAMPTTKGPMFNDKQVQLIEMVNNNRNDLPLDAKSVEMLDSLMDIVRWQQSGPPSLGGAVSDVASAVPAGAAQSAGAVSSATGLAARAAPSAGDATSGLGNAVKGVPLVGPLLNNLLGGLGNTAKGATGAIGM